MNEETSHSKPDEPSQEQESSPEEIEAYLQRNKEIHEKLMKERKERDEENRQNPRYAFGQWMHDWRMDHEISLRNFVISHNIDSVNYGKLEQGILAPPIDDPLTIHRLATIVFGLVDESEEYHKFWQRAKSAHIAITQAMSETYKFDVGLLPLSIHKADGGRLNQQELSDLANMIHEHHKPTNIGNIFKD